MKTWIHLVLLAGLLLGAGVSNAAPRAAEDPTAVVLSTTASAPRVKREAAKTSKTAKANKKLQKSGHGSKNAKAGHVKKTRKAR